MFSLILGSDDYSKSEREQLLATGLNELQNYWLLGKFMSEVEYNNGKTGKYIHNYLSFWKQFGFFPFIILFYIIFTNYIKLFILYIKNSIRNPKLYFICYVTTFVLLEICFARSYQHPYIWMSVSGIPVFLRYKKL